MTIAILHASDEALVYIPELKPVVQTNRIANNILHSYSLSHITTLTHSTLLENTSHTLIPQRHSYLLTNTKPQQKLTNPWRIQDTPPNNPTQSSLTHEQIQCWLLKETTLPCLKDKLVHPIISSPHQVTRGISIPYRSRAHQHLRQHQSCYSAISSHHSKHQSTGCHIGST